MRKLFLDDIRKPPDNSWDVVRNYSDFCNYLSHFGLPDVISFDHDLADEHYEIGCPSGFQEFDYTKCTEYTGLDCARFMINNYGVPKYWMVHSMNPVGKKNIEAELNAFVKRESEIAGVQSTPRPTWEERFTEAALAFYKLKTLTKTVPAATWTPEYRELAEAIHSLGREVFDGEGLASDKPTPLETERSCE
jgi:hypothetical protein